MSDEAGERQDPAAARRAWERFEKLGGLVGTPEIAERFGVTGNRARVMVRTDSFPAPVARLAGSDLWLAADVDAWRSIRGKRGRPSREALDHA